MSRSRRVALLLLLFCSVAAAPLAARATLLVHFDVEDLARKAKVVAIARVDSVETRWEDDRAMIATYTRLTVEDALAGTAPETVEIRVIGGTVDGVSAVVAGGAAFQAGDRVVVFLEPRRTRPDHWQVIGAFQGAFRLEREDETGMEVAVRAAPRGIAFARGEEVREARLYLDELVARVRATRGGK